MLRNSGLHQKTPTEFWRLLSQRVLVQPEMECRAFSTAIESRPDFIGTGLFKA